MRKWLLKLLVAVLALVGLFALVGEWKARKLGERLSGEVLPEDVANRTAVALKLSEAALEGLDKPNVYAYLTTEDCQKLIVDRLPEAIKITPPQGFKTLSIESVEVLPQDGFLAVRFDLEGELAAKPVSFDARVEIAAAPAFDGAGIALVPIAVRTSFQRVKMWIFDDDTVLPSLVQRAMTPLLQLLTARVSMASIPADLALNQTIDIEKLAADREEIESLQAPKVPVRLAYKRLAILPKRDGIALVGEVLPVAHEEYDAAVSALRALKAELASLPPPRPCEECGFRVSRFQEYLRCRLRSLNCRAERAFEVASDGERVLLPVELLALHDLGRSGKAEDREVFKALQPLLAPRIATGALTGWTPESVKPLLENMDGKFQLLRGKVDPEIGSEDVVSRVAIRRDLLASLLNTALARASVSARFAFEDGRQKIDQTLDTGPAPDLECAKRVGGCDSDEPKDPGFDPPCRSSCKTEKCRKVKIWPFGKKKICGPDLGCIAKKADCKAKNDLAKAAHETRKLAVYAEWKRKKDGCEVFREMKKTGCATAQKWLEDNQSKEVGRIEGEARFSEARAEVSNVTAEVSPNLSGFEVRGQIGGSSRVSASFVFTPLGAGHLICHSQWGDTLTATVGIEPTEVTMEAELDEAASARSGELVYRLEQREVALKMSPSPGLALLSQAPQALLACPAPAKALELLGAAGPIGHYVQVKLLLADERKVAVPASEIRIPLLNKEASAAGARAQVHREALVIEIH